MTIQTFTHQRPLRMLDTALTVIPPGFKVKHFAGRAKAGQFMSCAPSPGGTNTGWATAYHAAKVRLHNAR